MNRKTSTLLKELLAKPGIIVMPGVYDCISLRIVEKLGFKVALEGGYNCAASFAGIPDVGIITMTETVNWVRSLAKSVEIPVICDIDDGYGHLINVDRTAKEVIGTGAAGLLIEDQLAPRKSPSLGGSDIISPEAMIDKLRVICDVRKKEDPDFVIIARTFSSQVNGLKEAVKRGLIYFEEGADIVWVDIGYSDEVINELKELSKNLTSRINVMISMAEHIGRPLLKTKELEEMGFKVVCYPLTPLMAAAWGVSEVMRELRDKGTTKAVIDRIMPLKDVSKLTGIDSFMEFEKKWRTKQ